jgi:hypothetical protein
MADRIHMNPNDPGTGISQPARKLTCEAWEALLVDFLDGALTPADAASFQSHRQTCASCAEMFSQAGQGREWLNFLRLEPEVPPVLVPRILAQTSGSVASVSAAGDLVPAATVIPVAPVLPFWQRTGTAIAANRVAQPRLLMTAAMAFFSITLTLNMAGIRITAIRLADLKPSALSNNLDKQYHMATASVVRHVDNLRIVYEMEARWREIGRDQDFSPSEQPSRPSSSPVPDPGRKNGGKSEGPTARQPEPTLWGQRIEAGLRGPLAQPDSAGTALFPSSNPLLPDESTAGRAERGIA